MLERCDWIIFYMNRIESINQVKEYDSNDYFVNKRQYKIETDECDSSIPAKDVNPCLCTSRTEADET